MHRSRVGMDAQKPGLARELHKARFRAHHEKRLEEISKRTPGTGTVDNGPPYTVHLVHLKTRPKKKAILAARDAEVERANRELLRQMTKIFTTPSELVPVANVAAGGRGEGLGPCLSINVLCRKRELERIAAENRTWAKHLNEVSPSYSVDEWERDRRANKKVMERLRTVRYARAKNNPEDYSRRGVKRLRRQVERTRGQAFKAGYAAIPGELSLKIKRTTRMGKFGDGSGKSHRRQPKTQPKSRPPSASFEEEHGLSVSGVDDDAPHENDGPQLQRKPGDTVGTGGDCGAEHVGFRETRVGDQQSLPRSNTNVGQGSGDMDPGSPNRAGESHNQSEESSVTSRDGAVSQSEYSEFGDHGEDAEESDAEGEAEQQYSDFEDVNEMEGQKEEQCSDSGDEALRCKPDLPNTHDSNESGEDIAEAGATNPELAAEVGGDEVPCGSAGSSRELGGTGTQGTVGVEVKGDVDVQNSSGDVDTAPQDDAPSADGDEGHEDSVGTSSEADGTRKGRSEVESDDASLEVDTYTSASEASGPAAETNTTTTTSPALPVPSPPAEKGEGLSPASDTLALVNTPVLAPIMLAGDHEPAAASAESNESPAEMSTTHDVGNVVVCTQTHPRKACPSLPENREQPTDELPTLQNRPQSVSDPRTCQGGATLSGEEELLPSAAPLSGRDVEGQCVPVTCSESGATLVQSELSDGANVEREPIEVVEETGEIAAGSREGDTGSESAATDVPPLKGSASLSQAVPSAAERGEGGNSGAGQGPPRLTSTPPKVPGLGGGRSSTQLDIDVEPILSPHARTSQGESKPAQHAIPDEYTNGDDSTQGKRVAEVSSTPLISNERGASSTGVTEVEQGSARVGGEPAQSSEAASIEQAPEEELQPTPLSALPPTEVPSPSRPAATAEESSFPPAIVCHDWTENVSNSSADGPAGEGNGPRLPSSANEDGIGNGSNNPGEVAEAAVVTAEAKGNSPNDSVTGIRSSLPQAATMDEARGRDTGNVDGEAVTMVSGGSAPPIDMPSDQAQADSSRHKSIEELVCEGGESTGTAKAMMETKGSVAPLAAKDKPLTEGDVSQEPTRAEDSPPQHTLHEEEVGSIRASEEASSEGASKKRSPDGLDISAFGEEKAENVPTVAIGNDHNPTGGRGHFGDGAEVVEDGSGSATNGGEEIELAGTTGCTTVETGNPDSGDSHSFDPEASAVVCDVSDAAPKASRSGGDVSDVSDVGIDPPLAAAESEGDLCRQGGAAVVTS